MSTEKATRVYQRIEQDELAMVGSYTRWKGLVNTGLPLKSSLLLDELIPELVRAAEEYQVSSESFNDRVAFLESIEKTLVNLPVAQSKVSKFGLLEIDNVRAPWLQGLSIKEIKVFEKGQEICNDYYGYTLSWGRVFPIASLCQAVRQNTV